jgi:hypothetical protein
MKKTKTNYVKNKNYTDKTIKMKWMNIINYTDWKTKINLFVIFVNIMLMKFINTIDIYKQKNTILIWTKWNYKYDINEFVIYMNIVSNLPP